jgi:cbb3-type cytochrome oxidase maturation protein
MKMDEATIAQTILTGLIFITFLGVFIWGIKTGQFRNVEEAKYRMLDDKDKSKMPGTIPNPDKEKKT